MKCMANVTPRPYKPGTSIGSHLNKEGRGPRTWTDGHRESYLPMFCMEVGGANVALKINR